MGLEAPQIELVPEVGDGWCIFKWQPPQNITNPIKNYKLILSNLEYEILLDGTSTNYRQSSLENGKTYSASIQASFDGNHWGNTAHFSEFETGFPSSQGPQAAQMVPISSTSVFITWKPPAILPDAPIRWYVIESQSTCPTDSIESHTILRNTIPLHYKLENLNFKGRFRIFIYAVNCPGYSPPTPTNWIFNEPVPDFIRCTEFNPENKDGYLNFNKDKLSIQTNTGWGYSYNTSFPNTLFLPVGNLLTNSVTYCISVCKTGNSIPYSGLMMSRYPERGSGLCLGGSGTTLGYYWNDAPTALPVDTGITIEDNQWIHIVFIVEAWKVKLYKNATKVYEQEGMYSQTQITRIFFGRNPVSDNLCFPGLVSNIRFYNRVLSDEEILNIFYTIKN